MKFSRAIFLSLCLATAAAFAGTGADYSTRTTAATGNDTDTVLPIEFDIEYAYIGKSDVERGFRENRDIDENYYSGRLLYRPRTKVGYLRLGVAYERFDFGGLDPFSVFPPVPAPGQVGVPSFATYPSELPDTLQSVSAVVGLDTKFSDSLLFRIEAQPGFYGTDDLDTDTFNVPIIVGGTYLYNDNLQFVLGVSVDYERKYPVFPGGGIRWRLAPRWVLNAVVPTPRLEFEASRNITIYAGADLKGSSFRVDDDFAHQRFEGGVGLNAGDQRLNHAVLTYSEIRTGAGVEWKITPDVKISVEGGYLPYREFDYHRADIRYKYESGAPYGAVALHAAF